MGFHGFDNNSGKCEEPHSLEYYHWINFVLISIIATIGLVAQLIVITVLGRIKKKTSTDIFLLALSVLDIFVIISLSLTENGSIYLHILSSSQQMLNAGYLSVVFHPIEHIVHFASTWCVVLMSLDRYISICHMNRARYWCTVQKAKTQIAVLMLVVIIYSIPRFVEYYPVFGRLHEFISECDAEVHVYPEGSLGNNVIYIWVYTFGTYFLVMYVAPLSLLCFFNYHLIKMIKGRISFHKRRNNQISPGTPKRNPSMVVPSEVSSSDFQDEPPHNYSTIPKLTTLNKFTQNSEDEKKVAPDEISLTPLSTSDTTPSHKELSSDSSASGSNTIEDIKNRNNNVLDYKKAVRAVTTLSHNVSNEFAENLTIEKNHNRYIQRQYDHVIRMLITVTVIFSICQIPDMIQQIISRIGRWTFSDEFGIIAYDFVIINSSINLFIYTATSQRFKKKLTKTFKFLRRKDRVSPKQKI